MDLIFLGTGAGNGVPNFYCDCRVCKEAIEIPEFRRTRSSIVITGEKNVLIDAPPEISSQLQRENIRQIDHLFITHAHHDHCAGLGDIEIYARFFLKKKLPVVMSRETQEQLETIHGKLPEWMNLTLLYPNQVIQVGNTAYTALNVSHAEGTFGYLIDTQGSKTAYIPDTGPLPEETMDRLKGIDRLIIDATFYGDNWYPDQHLTVSQAVDVFEKIKAKALYLTHLSMHYATPVTSEEILSEIKAYKGKVRLATDGMRLSLEEPSVRNNNHTINITE